MGMFDTVWARCPECHNEIELQTKGGGNLLNHYPSYKVPFDAGVALLSSYHYAKDVNGYITCEYCNEKLYLTVTPTYDTEYVLVQLHLKTEKASIEKEQYE